MIVFIDEVDSVCRQRNMKEEDHSRRVKTELLRQVWILSPIWIVAVYTGTDGESWKGQYFLALCNQLPMGARPSLPAPLPAKDIHWSSKQVRLSLHFQSDVITTLTDQVDPSC